MNDTSVHLSFDGEIFSYYEDSCSFFSSEISQKIMDLGLVELAIESPLKQSIRFIPDHVQMVYGPAGFIINQFGINLVVLPPNDESTPYVISSSHFDDSTVQNDHLCVNWEPLRRRNNSLFKIFTGSEKMIESSKYQSVRFVKIQMISKSLPPNLISLYHITKDRKMYKIRANFLEDCKFHYIDEDGKDIGTAAILTFNELAVVVPEHQKTYDQSYFRTIAKSFQKKPLSETDKQKSIILNYFIDSIALFKTSTRFYAPFVTICQSSGVGKSKFVLECGEDIPLIYGVFRADSDQSYPPMSDWIKLFVDYVLAAPMDSVPKGTDHIELAAQDYSVGRVLIFIYALLEAYKEFFELYEPFAFQKINLMFHTIDGHAKFNENVKSHLNNITTSAAKVTFSQVFKNIRKVLSQISPSKKYKNAPFVIVFDELSLLLEIEFSKHINLFHIIRRALHLFPFEDKLNLLIVGIGTNGDVSIFHKEISDDSLRFSLKNLFLPSLILGANWDIFKKFINLNNFKLTGRNVKNSKMIKLICSFGRALWSSLPFGDVISVAQQKLKNGSDTNLFTTLAVWSIRTSLSLNSDLALARTLLRSYMAIAFSINYNAETMNIGYPSEPILALAARNTMMKFSAFNFTNMLQVLLEFVQLRPVDKGELTEVIFAQIVLLAIDNADNVASKENENYPMSCEADDVQLNQIFNSQVFLLENLPDIDSPVVVVPDSTATTANYYSYIQKYYHITTVDSFLKTLYGDVKGAVISDSLGESLRFGIINASHVISALNSFPYENVYNQSEMESIHHREKEAAGTEPGAGAEPEPEPKGEKEKENFEGDVIDHALLRNLFLRQAALKTPPRYYGLDMCIPVLMKRPSDSEEAEGVFGYIGMQFKSTYVSEAGVIAKMDPALHYVRCGAHRDCQRDDCQFRTNDQDLSLIYDNHLLLYMAAANEYEAGQSENISTFKGVPCHVTRSIQELAEQSKLFTSDDCGLIQNIIHAQNDPFKSANEFQLRKVADNVLTMAPLRYVEADGDLRTARGLNPLPDPFRNDDVINSKWSNVDSTNEFIEVSVRKVTPKVLEKSKKNFL